MRRFVDSLMFLLVAYTVGLPLVRSVVGSGETDEVPAAHSTSTDAPRVFSDTAPGPADAPSWIRDAAIGPALPAGYESTPSVGHPEAHPRTLGDEQVMGPSLRHAPLVADDLLVSDDPLVSDDSKTQGDRRSRIGTPRTGRSVTAPTQSSDPAPSPDQPGGLDIR